MTAARTLTVSEIIKETSDASSIVFDVPADEPETWSYRPGQFLTLRIPSDQTGSVARCYSMSSSPDVDKGLRVTVKRTIDGYGSNWLCDHLVAGSTIDALPPKGQFTPKSLDGDFILFAGGSGITPVFSILQSALSKGTGHVTLFYGNRDRDSVIFAQSLETLVSEHSDRLRVVHWLESDQGIPSESALHGFASDHLDRQAFICGPGPFMKTVSASLEAAGVPRENIHLEVFTSLSGDPFAEVERTDPVDPDAATTPVEIQINGETLEFEWSTNDTLVDLLLARDIDVPYMCRDGECGTCEARVECGSVAMDRNDVLDPDDVAAGYVLTCQLRPTGTDPIRIVY